LSQEVQGIAGGVGLLGVLERKLWPDLEGVFEVIAVLTPLAMREVSACGRRTSPRGHFPYVTRVEIAVQGVLAASERVSVKRSSIIVCEARRGVRKKMKEFAVLIEAERSGSDREGGGEGGRGKKVS